MLAISADSFNSNSSLIISGGLLVGTAATFNGNVNIAGVLTYDDVTNIDSVGLITARSGISVVATGVTIATSFVSGGLVLPFGGIDRFRKYNKSLMDYYNWYINCNCRK